MEKTYYEILGVSQNASQDEIKKAYRSKMKNLHPDLHPDDLEAEEESKRVNEAYEILSKEEKRKQYDLSLINSQTTTVNNYSNPQTSIFDAIIQDFANSMNTQFNDKFDYTKDFDEFMEFLDKMDKEFQDFGYTSDNIRKKVSSKRGILTLKEINNYKLNIKSQLETLRKNAKYYDEFITLYNETKLEVNTWNPPFNEEYFKQYLSKLNRGKQPKEYFEKAIEKLKELKYQVSDVKDNENNKVLKELEKRYLTGVLTNYMRLKNISMSLNLTKEDLKYLNEFITLYDKIIASLTSMKMRLNDLLGKMNKSIESLSLDELKIILKNVEEMKQQNIFQRLKYNEIIQSELEQANSPKK